MTRLLALWFATAWVGATLALSSLRWFRRPSLVDRLAPYAPASPAATTRPRVGRGGWGAYRTILAPLAVDIGGRLARAMGVDEDLATRLRRIHADVSPTEFRLRQLGTAVVAITVGTAVALALTPPAPVAALLVIGPPALAFLLPEDQLARRSAEWRHRVERELPVVSEQLGMLLAAGYSLGAAIDRLARRGDGACARDLRRVRARIGHGLTEVAALREWAELARVDGVDRLVAVLSLHRQSSDLGRLIADEARALRRDAHRELREQIARKAQMVWIPVTVAALVPGTLFLVVPFLEAMRLFTG
ncbi:MAG TPA: type II secretion system F family protein [Acidimicrobiales bacterium]|nr:type II secretion system F family protein [Acidimicrobiales bacterium]